MIWPLRVTASTHRPDGRRVRMCRLVEGAGDSVKAMRKALLARKDRGVPFHGCEVHGLTVLGQRIIRTFEYDDTLREVSHEPSTRP